MLSKPNVTIIIPYKKNLRYLFSALKSVFNQTFKNYVINIIYDNENKTDLYEIKKFLKKKNLKKKNLIKIQVNKKNIGAGHSRNKGIKKSKTKYIAFLDSDDRWTKDKLKYQIYFMEKKKLSFSHTSYNIIDSKDKVISYRIARPVITLEELIKSCDVGLSTVIIKTEFLKKNNYYFPGIKTKEDFVLWLKIAKNLKFLQGIKKKLTYYRKTSNSLSSNKFISLINGYRVYRSYMKFSKIKSIYFLTILSVNSFKKKILKKKIDK
jgi:teichuronic acid biosynthesis glycosyltransferase TuaG